MSHHCIYNRNQQTWRLIYHILISTLHTLIMVYTLKTTHLLASSRHKEIPLMSIVSFISMAGDFIEHTVAHIEPLFTRKYEEEMYQIFEEINTIFATKLNHVVDYNALRKKQNYTIGFFIFSAMQAFGLSFFSLPTEGLTLCFYLMCRAVSVTIIRVRRCQSSFVINLLSNILMDVQVLLKQLQESYHQSSNKDLSQNIVHLRDIYSKVWLIKNLISRCFGFSLLVFVLDYCCDFINSSYWAYVIIKTYKSKMKILRKTFFEISFWFI